MSLIHPTDRRLAALIDGDLAPPDDRLVAEHVAGCARCQQRVGQATGVAFDRPEVDPALSRMLVVPADGAFESRDDPVAGDVWRVVWDGLTELALVRPVDTENGLVTALPMMDVDDADEWSMVTAFKVGDVEVAVAASVALEVTLPWCVLDARVGGLGADAMTSCALLRTAFRSGGDSAGQANVGAPVWSRLDERAEALDDLAERFHDLANADWVPGKQVVEAAVNELPKFAELRSAGLPPDRALDLQRGDQPTPEEAAAIEAALGIRLESGSPVVPPDLRRRLDRPRWRPDVRRRAAANQRPEPDERLAVVAEVIQPMAARGTHGKPVDWDFLLEHVLRG